MKTFNILYRLKRYGKWETGSIKVAEEVNLRTLVNFEILKLCKDQINRDTVECKRITKTN